MIVYFKGERVIVTTDTPKLEKKHFRGVDAVWIVTSTWDTNTEGVRANLKRVGQPNQRRSKAIADLRRVKGLPSALL